MSLALLAPGLLALGVLLAGPVLVHLTRQTITDRRAFGALLLLQRLPRNVQRRRRLADRLLLALRLAALGLLLLAAAAPELRRPRDASTFGGSGRVVVLLDNSLSMDQRAGGDSAFALARTKAEASVRGLPEGVRVALVTTGGTAHSQPGELTEDRNLVAAAIAATEQSSGVTDLAGAMVLARTLLGGEPGEVVVYTDEAGPGLLEGIAHDLERLHATGAIVLAERFGPPSPQNVVPTAAVYGDGIEGGGVTVTLVSYGLGDREVPTTLSLPDGTRLTSFVALPGASPTGPGTAEVRFTVPRQAAGGVARVEVEDLSLPLDNVRYFHLPRVGASRVIVVDGDPGSTPTRSEVYFLERALAPWAAGGLGVDVVAPAGFGALDPARHRVAFLANVADPGLLAPRLVEFVRGGGGLVLAMGENVTPERYNVALASLLPAPLRKVRDLVALDAEAGVPLSPPQPGVEPFRALLREGPGPFRAVRARRVMTSEPLAPTEDVDVLLSFEGGVPALLERRIGAGRVLTWMSTVDLGWGNLPLQALFPPLLQRIVTWLGGEVGGAQAVTDATVGIVVEAPVPAGAAELSLRGPSGGFVASERGVGTLRFVPAVAGPYTLGLPDEPPLLSVAVNTPLSESDVRRTSTFADEQRKVSPDQLTERWPLAPGLQILAAACLLAAGFAARAAPEPA